MTTVTVSNPTRTRKFGWGYSTTPERNSTRILYPTSPDYTGTFASILRQIDEDRTYRSFRSGGGTLMTTRWFYEGRRVVNTDEFLWQINDIYQDRERAKELGRPMPPQRSITIEIED